jgi:hypothetical protein
MTVPIGQTIQAVGVSFRHLGAMVVIFPLLAIVGPALFGFYGWRGVVHKHTIVFGGRVGRRARHVFGGYAVALGFFYFLTSALMAVLMIPIALAICGVNFAG